MERHHMKMAVGVITRSDGDAPADGEVARTHTAFDNQTHAPAALDESSLARRRVDRMHTVVLTGSLDRDSAHQLEREIERLCEEGVTGITLDMSELAHIEAIGVAVVAFRCRLCRRRGYEFALTRGPRAIQLAFEQAGLGECLPFSDSPSPVREHPSSTDAATPTRERPPARGESAGERVAGERSVGERIVRRRIGRRRLAEQPLPQPALPRLEPAANGELRVTTR